MSMASVHAGSFDIENEKLVFRAAEKPDNVSSIFEREVERLNEYAEDYEWTFVSVCANQSTVFVAIDDIYFNMVKVYEIDAKNPKKFETIEEKTIEEKTSTNGTVNPLFGNKVRVKMMCCSGINQAAVLIIDEDDFGRVWLRLSKYQGDYQYADKSKHGVDTWKIYTITWLECPVYYHNSEQDIAMIVCGELHCAALTTEGNVFTCVIPESFTFEIGMENNLPTWIISGNLAALALEGGGHQRALQKIVDDMDVELRYKTRSDPMAASFGVTGGLRNPYLLNINTDGQALDKLIEKHNNETKARTVENRKAVADRVKREVEMKAQRDNEVQRIKALEEEIEDHENTGKNYKTNLEEAAKKMQEAKRLHDEAHSVHSEHDTKLKTLKKKLQNEETVMGIKSVSTLSTNPHDYPEVDNRSTGNSKSKKSLKQKVSNFFFGKESSAENELHFEDIARFSASREHRCTYI